MPNDLLVLEKGLLPSPQPPTYMIAGFHQEANQGNVSTGIPTYLIEKTKARKVGRINGSFGFSPFVRYQDGLIVEHILANDFYYTEHNGKGIVIFLGSLPVPNERLDNPYEDLHTYADALLDGAQELNVRRIVSSTGRFTEVPYGRGRIITTTYNLPQLKEELSNLGLTFPPNFVRSSDGNIIIMNHAAQRNLEVVRMSARVPAYSITDENGPLVIRTDYRAFLDILIRIKSMFEINIDLSDLERRSEELTTEWRQMFDNLRKNPDINHYLESVEQRYDVQQSEESDNMDPRLRAELNQILRGTGEDRR